MNDYLKLCLQFGYIYLFSSDIAFFPPRVLWMTTWSCSCGLVTSTCSLQILPFFPPGYYGWLPGAVPAVWLRLPVLFRYCLFFFSRVLWMTTWSCSCSLVTSTCSLQPFLWPLCGHCSTTSPRFDQMPSRCVAFSSDPLLRVPPVRGRGRWVWET